MIKLAISLIGLLVGGVFLLSSMKVPAPTKDNTVTVNGKVEKIYEASEDDVVFILENDERIYYINRGLEKGLNLLELRNKHLGKTLTLTYIDHSHLFKPFVDNRHLAEVKTDISIIYSEMK